MVQALVVSNILLWVICIILGVFCFALARQIGVLYERVAPAGALAMNQKLRSGMQAPVVEAVDINDTNVTIGGSLGYSLLLFFLSPTCPVCKTLLPILRSIDNAESDWLKVVLVSDGDGQSKFIAENNLRSFRYVVSEDVGRHYAVAKLPYAVLIDEQGVISALGLVNSREHIESLFEAHERGVGTVQEYLRAVDQ